MNRCTISGKLATGVAVHNTGGDSFAFAWITHDLGMFPLVVAGDWVDELLDVEADEVVEVSGSIGDVPKANGPKHPMGRDRARSLLVVDALAREVAA